MKTKSYSRVVRDSSNLYEAIVNKRWKLIRSLLKNKDVNDPVMTTGPLSGYTPLHIACMGTDHQLVELFLRTYKPDVNVVADDGTQPLHLVCLLESPEKLPQLRWRRLRVLLEANANVDSEIRQETFLKFVKDKEWCPDFGDKMTPLTYAIVYNLKRVAELLLKFNPNVKIISLTNKTLLMYVLDNDTFYEMTSQIARRIKDPEFMNHRDNDGMSTIHYLLHPKKFEISEYELLYFHITINLFFISYALTCIIDAGADVHALVNNDPSTFIFNMAAYRGCLPILQYMLLKNLSMPLSRGLYYVTLPRDKNLNDFNVLPEHDREERLSWFRERRIECTTEIVKDLVNRRTFRLPVQKEEIQLLDNLLVTNKDVRNIVNNYKKKFIEGKLKKSFIEVSDRKMTLFDFIMEVFDDKKIKLLVIGIKDMEQFRQTLFESHYSEESYPDLNYFTSRVRNRLTYFQERYKLLQDIIKLSQLTEAILLPFELILDIIDYVPNKDLDTLIMAFKTSELYN